MSYRDSTSTTDPSTSRGSRRQDGPSRQSQSRRPESQPYRQDSPPHRSASHSRPQDPPNTSKWGQAASAAEQGRTPNTWQEEDQMNDSRWLGEETRRVQCESRDSSSRALRRLEEASVVASENLTKVNSQSEQFNRMERKLDEAAANAKNVDAKVDHLKSLNRFFFLPSFGAKKAARKEEEFKKQQESMVFSSKLAKERDLEWKGRDERIARGDGIGNVTMATQKTWMTTPEGVERDEVEEEIDANLGHISTGLSRLKMMGAAMSVELDSHQGQIRRIEERTEVTRSRVDRLNGKVDRIKQ